MVVKKHRSISISCKILLVLKGDLVNFTKQKGENLVWSLRKEKEKKKKQLEGKTDCLLVSKYVVKADDELVFLFSEVSSLEIRPKVVYPP